jgi:hypothetical protein
MAQLRFLRSLAAGEVFDPLTNWQYRYAPRAGVFSLLLAIVGAPSTADQGVVATITSGSDTLSEEGPIQQNDPAATGSLLPRPDNTVPIVDNVDGGDLLKVSLRNTRLAAAVVAGVIEFNG